MSAVAIPRMFHRRGSPAHDASTSPPDQLSSSQRQRPSSSPRRRRRESAGAAGARRHSSGSGSGAGAGVLSKLAGLTAGKTGSLGLSRAELDRRCRPSGLYPCCEWDDRAIRRLIGDGKLAARLRGSDSRSRDNERECPICFLHYSSINITLCCGATVCTECYLQVRPQRQRDSPCPFCNNPRLTIAVARRMGRSEREVREREEQRVIEARIRARGTRSGRNSGGSPACGSLEGGRSNHSRSCTDSVHEPPRGNDEGGEIAVVATPCQSCRDLTRTNSAGVGVGVGGFGSSLEAHASVVRRTRSTVSETTSEDVSSLALTPAERQAIELSMSAQTSHASWRRVEEEAETRRLENERSHYRQSRLDADRELLRAHGIPVRGVMDRMASDSRILSEGGGAAAATAADGGHSSGLMHEILPPRQSTVDLTVTEKNEESAPQSSSEVVAADISMAELLAASVSRISLSQLADTPSSPAGGGSSPRNADRHWHSSSPMRDYSTGHDGSVHQRRRGSNGSQRDWSYLIEYYEQKQSSRSLSQDQSSFGHASHDDTNAFGATEDANSVAGAQGHSSVCASAFSTSFAAAAAAPRVGGGSSKELAVIDAAIKLSLKEEAERRRQAEAEAQAEAEVTQGPGTAGLMMEGEASIRDLRRALLDHDDHDMHQSAEHSLHLSHYHMSGQHNEEGRAVSAPAPVARASSSSLTYDNEDHCTIGSQRHGSSSHISHQEGSSAVLADILLPGNGGSTSISSLTSPGSRPKPHTATPRKKSSARDLFRRHGGARPSSRRRLEREIAKNAANDAHNNRFDSSSTQDLTVRGIPEEEQVAMAIALSLRLEENRRRSEEEEEEEDMEEERGEEGQRKDEEEGCGEERGQGEDDGSGEEGAESESEPHGAEEKFNASSDEEVDGVAREEVYDDDDDDDDDNDNTIVKRAGPPSSGEEEEGVE